MPKNNNKTKEDSDESYKKSQKESKEVKKLRENQKTNKKDGKSQIKTRSKSSAAQSKVIKTELLEYQNQNNLEEKRMNLNSKEITTLILIG